MIRLPSILHGAGFGARIMRSSSWIVLGFGFSQGLRLGSNLVLTRLLFPEAFGLMALIGVFTVGLTMFSDVGLGPSIQQNRRGDDPDFLDTAWTIQMLRGVVLWICCCALAIPAAHFYSEPLLACMLPVAGLGLLVAGFNPTRIETANRHLLVGRLTLLDIAAQVLSAIVMLILAWWMRSVWALVIGGVIGSIIKLFLMHWLLPGRANHVRWETSAVRDLISFGKWIFLSTLCGFILAQGDKAILGRYLTMDRLGIYNIGYFLACFPLALATAVSGRVMIPLYRDIPPRASSANFEKIRRARFLFSAVVLTAQFAMAICGSWLIAVLYDARFSAAGAVAIAVACANIPYIIGMTYDQSALAAGDSRRFFYLLIVKAVTQICLFMLGLQLDGLRGALIAVGLSATFVHLMVIWLARRHGAWDWLHDLVWATIGSIAIFYVVWLHGDDLQLLNAFAH